MPPVLHVLGAGSILPRAGHGCSGYALEVEPAGPLTLLDLGPGSLRRLAEAGLDFERIERVVFSHYHPDHCLDIYALAFARGNPSATDLPAIDLVGPPGLAALVNGPPPALAAYASLISAGPGARVHEVELDADGCAGIEAGGLALRCVRNGHSSTLVTLSWRVEFPGGESLGYTGDTDFDPRVADLFQGVDLCLAECSFPDDNPKGNHLTPSSAARLAERAEARKLVLTHFYPELDPEDARRAAARVFPRSIELARDGSIHRI